ncbi:MAG: M3 family metallopeptidase [Acidobacteria bacterium]|nr:M3 family metallopeptidase [Acidobacteriota bacterium]
MKTTVWSFMLILTAGCGTQPQNPLLVEWDTPFGTPPFEEIQNGHFMPAFREAMAVHKGEVGKIIQNPEEPTFKNTVEAYEKSGRLLDRVDRVFGCLNDAETNPELQAVSEEVEPLLTKHYDDILLDPGLFNRVDAIYSRRESIGLNEEESTLLENIYKDFVRSGAGLDEKDKAALRTVNEELSALYVKFRKNHLDQTNAAALTIENESDLAGLPGNLVAAAADNARSRGMEGKWVITLQKPSFEPFLQYSEKRPLREKVYKSYINRGNNGGESDNKAVVARIAALRAKRSRLLGYKTHADFILERNMAKNPDNVYRFLNDLWEPALARARAEAAEMQAIIDREGGGFRLAGWDWWYYAEKLKKEKYALDDAMLRPYFEMDKVRRGAFGVAEKLYGIQFIPRSDIQVYHPDVEVFEVQEADGSHLGIFYTDYFPRAGKRAGAWSGSLRSQSNMDGNYIAPLVFNVGNFSKPAGTEPALLNTDEVETLFHELGHALDSLFSDTVYAGSRRTPRDFVELPSQIMENWAMDPEVLPTYAVHYETKEPIPQELIDKIQKASLFNQGFRTVEYLAASFLDMDWHSLTEENEVDTGDFEAESLNAIGLMEEIASRYQSTNFGHIFDSQGYSAGYYSYIWAEVLDADAFQAFKEAGLFNRELAQSFRENVLSHGSTDMMAQYVRFRGAEPKVDALLARRGLK